MKAIIITLQSRPERRLNAFHMAESLRALGIDVVELPATDFSGQDFREIDYASREQLEQPMTAGELACAWSHYRACMQVVETGQPAFIIEDDAHLLYPLDEVVLEGVTEFLALSCWDARYQRALPDVVEPGEDFDLVRGLPYGTQCYYVTPAGAMVVAGSIRPIRWPSDVALDNLSRSGILRTHLAKKPVAVQHGLLASHIGTR